MPSKSRPSCDSSLFLDSLEIGLWGEKEKHVEYRVFVEFQERMRSALAKIEAEIKDKFDTTETYTHDCHASLTKRVNTNQESANTDIQKANTEIQKTVDKIDILNQYVETEIQEVVKKIDVINEKLTKLPELRDAYARDYYKFDVRIDDLEYRVYGPDVENWPAHDQSDTEDESHRKEYSSSEEEPAPKPYRPRASPENEEDPFNYEPVSSQKTQKNARNTL